MRMTDFSEDGVSELQELHKLSSGGTARLRCVGEHGMWKISFAKGPVGKSLEGMFTSRHRAREALQKWLDATKRTSEIVDPSLPDEDMSDGDEETPKITLRPKQKG